MPREFYVRLIHLYIDESHKYYVLEEPNGISDGYFDAVCKRLYDDYDKVPEDLHWVLDPESLKAGTGFDITNEQYQKWYTQEELKVALVPPFE